MPVATRPVEERFWEKVNKDGPIPAHRPELGPCAVWTRSLNGDGYGRFRLDSATVVQAHRFAFEQEHGPIPVGLEPDHLCRNHPCVKVVADEHGPAHIELVTRRTNILRGENHVARQMLATHCPRGHPYSAENTYTPPNRRCRECRTCHRELERERDNAA